MKDRLPHLAVPALLAVLGCGGSAATTSDAGSQSTAQTAVGAKCAATPTLLLHPSDLLVPDSGFGGISAGMDLAVNATDLYVGVTYDASGAVLRVPIRGGLATEVAPVVGTEEALLVTGDSLVFAQSHGSPNDWTGDIVRVGLQDGSRTVLASAGIVPATIFGPNGILATDGKDVYFAAQEGTKAVPVAGGSVRTLTTRTGPVAIVGPNLVIADSSAESIFRVPLAGGPAVALATNQSGDLGPILGCGPNICWASAVPVSPSESGTGVLMQLGPTGAAAPLSESEDLYVVYRLVFDGNDFFATMLADASFGILARVPAAGGAPMVGGFGAGLAIDDECLYFGDVTDGVYSVAKSAWNKLP